MLILEADDFFFSFRPKKECSTGWLSKILVFLYIIYYLFFPLKVDFIWPQIAFSRDGSLCGSHYYSSLSAPFSARERNRVEFTSPIFPHESSCFIWYRQSQSNPKSCSDNHQARNRVTWDFFNFVKIKYFCLIFWHRTKINFKRIYIWY